MKVFYCTTAKNFGDVLNGWMWNELIPDLLVQDDPLILCGIGSILGDAFVAPDGLRVVMGSGFGYGNPLKLDDSWNIRFVRGPITAKALGIDPALALTDAAIFLPGLITAPPPSPTGQAAFMPHFLQHRYSGEDLQPLIESLGWKYLDPTRPFMELIHDIRACSRLYASAMHGVIVADLFRIPWVPVFHNKAIYNVKWHDWAQSMEVPLNIHRVYHSGSVISRRGAVRRLDYACVKAQFQMVKWRARPMLSSDAVLLDRQQRALDAIALLRQDYPRLLEQAASRRKR